MAARDELAKVENERRLRQEERLQEARDSMTRSRAHFVRLNPGAVSPQERESVLSEFRDMGLTRREDEEAASRRLDIRAANEWQVDVEKARGENALKLAERQGADALALADKNNQMQTELEKIRAEKEREIGKSQYGYFDAEGNYHAGSNATAAAEQARAQQLIAQGRNDATVRSAEIRAEGAKEVAEERAAMQKYGIDQKSAIALKRLESQMDGKDKSLQASIVRAAVESGQIDPELGAKKLDEILGKGTGSGGGQPRATGTWARK